MFILLLLLWIVFNGQFTIEILLFGIAFSAVIYLFACKFLNFSVSRDIMQIMEVFLFLWYVLNLILEIIKANIGTLKLLNSSKSDIEPVIVTFETDLESQTARTLLADSITMTPGTITILLEDNKYTVHCLDKEMAVGLDESSFVFILRKMEALRKKYEAKIGSKESGKDNSEVSRK